MPDTHQYSDLPSGLWDLVNESRGADCGYLVVRGSLRAVRAAPGDAGVLQDWREVTDRLARMSAGHGCPFLQLQSTE